MNAFDRKAILAAAALLVVGSGVVLRQLLLDEAARIEAIPYSHTPETIAKTPPPNLRTATIRVLSNSCGNSYDDPAFREQAQFVSQAGPKIVPLLTELVLDPASSDWLVGNAALQAAKYPFSAALRDAVRTRRDGRGVSSQAMLAYFGQFGDQTDLLWLQAKGRAETRHLRDEAEKAAKRLSSRLLQNQPPSPIGAVGSK